MLTQKLLVRSIYIKYTEIEHNDVSSVLLLISLHQ